MATTMDLETFRYRGSHKTYDSFEVGNGFGPFTAQKSVLHNEVMNSANPFASAHTSGCMGAGKTTLLKLIENDLLRAEKTVSFFKNSRHLDSCQLQIMKVLTEKVEAHFLVDEAHASPSSPMFAHLLKNDNDHHVTTIGAGVPAFESAANSFASKIATDRSFFTSEELQNERVIDFFARGVMDAAVRGHIESLLGLPREHVGGHIYPLMRLSELPAPKLTTEGHSIDQVIAHLSSADFRNSQPFQLLASRVTPRVADVNIRAIFHPQEHRLGPEVLELEKHGFCDHSGKVTSISLFDLSLASVGGTVSSCPWTSLSASMTGIQELLCWGAPQMSWSHCTPHGGAIEDALTFELLKKLADATAPRAVLFNPKLVTAGAAAHQPDIHFNTSVHSCVECALAKDNTQSA